LLVAQVVDFNTAVVVVLAVIGHQLEQKILVVDHLPKVE
jgi:hypothetical protein|tara:strand:+ start:412 stop:528 length:117 start_codon:yes stop_codon:yes gene_type:complete